MKQQYNLKSSAAHSVIGTGAARGHISQQREHQRDPGRVLPSSHQHDGQEEKTQEEAARPGPPHVGTTKSVPSRPRQQQQASPKACRHSRGFASSDAHSPEQCSSVASLEPFLNSSASFDSRLPGEKAAHVMREYLLPMLEAHRIKQEDIQRRKMFGSPSSRQGRENEAKPASPASPPSSPPASGGILSEMQLSDALLSELETAKNHISSLQGRLTASEAAKEEAETQLEACSSSLSKLKIELEHTKQKESFSRLHITQTESDCAALRWQLQQLEVLISHHHAEQARLTQRVTTLQEANEELSRKLAVAQNSAALMQHEHDVLTEQLRGLSAAAKELPTVKKLQDDILYEQLLSKAQIKDIQRFSKNLQNECAKLAEERICLLEVKKDLTIQRDRLSEDVTRLGKELEEARQHIAKETSQRNEELERLTKERESIDKQVKELLEEREKYKQRIARFRARRRLFEAEQRTCKNCGNDYDESENYNWSCRTHHSGYGGEMWWCCGRLGKNAPGCRFNKHESRDDEDELEEEKQEREAASHCPKDPNPRAGAADVNPKDELRRLEILGNQERSQQQRKGKVIVLSSLVEAAADRIILRGRRTKNSLQKLPSPHTPMECGTAVATELAEKFGLEALRCPPDDEDIFAELRRKPPAHQFVVDVNPTDDGEPALPPEDVLPNAVPDNAPTIQTTSVSHRL